MAVHNNKISYILLIFVKTKLCTNSFWHFSEIEGVEMHFVLIIKIKTSTNEFHPSWIEIMVW
jgi:hypothetical protein